MPLAARRYSGGVFPGMKDFAIAYQREQRLLAHALVKDVQALMAREIYRQIIETTPVLTGQARYNWFPTIGAPSEEVVYFRTPSWDALDARGATALAPPDGAAQATGEPMNSVEAKRIRSVIAELKKSELGQQVYIRNNLEYVAGLDAGSSTKAPNGIVDVAIIKALRLPTKEVLKDVQVEQVE